MDSYVRNLFVARKSISEVINILLALRSRINTFKTIFNAKDSCLNFKWCKTNLNNLKKCITFFKNILRKHYVKSKKEKDV